LKVGLWFDVGIFARWLESPGEMSRFGTTAEMGRFAFDFKLFGLVIGGRALLVEFGIVIF
jgi:hypothetical protein